MQITKVEFYKNPNKESKLKGIATLYLDNMFVVKNVRLIEGKKGLFIAMPNRETSSGERVDVCNPLNQETRDMFEQAVIDKYQEY